MLMVTFGKWSIIKTFYFKSECHILKDKRNAIKRGEEMIKDCATKLRLLAVAFVLAVGHMLVFAPSQTGSRSLTAVLTSITIASGLVIGSMRRKLASRTISKR